MGRDSFEERQRRAAAGELRKAHLPRPRIGLPGRYQRSRNVVYFILATGLGMVKIGKTSGHVKRRLVALQTASPVELKCIGTVPGGSDAECILHTHFARLHVRGEWFRMDDEITEFLHQHNTYGEKKGASSRSVSDVIRDLGRQQSREEILKSTEEIDAWLATLPGVGPNFPLKITVLTEENSPTTGKVPPRIGHFVTQVEWEDYVQQLFGAAPDFQDLLDEME
jgi:hypothetical protein